MHWPLLLSFAAPVLEQTDVIAKGLENGPIRYIAALSLAVNLGLFGMLMRIQSLRVRELKENAAQREKLGGIIEKHNQAMLILEKTTEFVSAQLPRRKPHSVDSLASEGRP